MNTLKREVPIWVSARHVHLTEKDIHTLFNWELTHFKDLSQPGQFAANEKVDLYGPMQIPGVEESRKIIKWVRVLWPSRFASQVELTATEARQLWIKDTPVRMSWDIAWTPGLLLKWPNGQVELEQWVIVAKNHLHITPDQAAERWLHDGDSICVWSHDRKRQSLLTNVIVRVSDSAALDLHIDTEEWNAMGIENWMTGLILELDEISWFLLSQSEK